MSTPTLYRNSPEVSYLLHRELTPEASYALKDTAAPPPTLVDTITSLVVPRVGTLPKPRMNEELSEVLSEFRIAASESSLDLSNAAALEIVDAEDGSVLIEWRFKDRRLGFNIEPDAGQSGWYYAFSRDSGGQCGSGLLSSLDMKMLLRRMLGDAPRR